MKKLALVLLLSGCASTGLPQVVDPSEISAASGGPPTITRIRDIGTPLLPRTGTIEGGLTDGVAGPGELLVIEGNRFGRQPTVLVGARPATVLARTDGGGVVVRVPRAVETGDVDVVVSNASGAGHAKTALRRLALALSDKLRFASITDDVKAAGELALPGRVVRVDSTGGLGLVLGDSKISVVDLGRAQPGLLGALALSHKAEQLVVATDAPRAIAIGGGKLSVLDTTSLRRPVLFDAAALPKEVSATRAAVLSPDGRTLAILGKGNQVVALDVSTPTAPQLLNVVDTMPGERQALARDLAFSPDGNTLWVVSGVSAETYPQVIPVRITAVKLVAIAADGSPVEEGASAPSVGAARRLVVWKTQVVPGAGAPVSIVVGNAPDAQGSAIRTAPEVASVFVSVVKDALFGKAVLAPGAGTNGVIARAELGAGGGPVASTRDLLGDLVLLPDGSHVAALAARPVEGSDNVELGVASVSVDGQTTVRFAPLSTSTQKQLAAPFRLGDLAVQP